MCIQCYFHLVPTDFYAHWSNESCSRDIDIIINSVCAAYMLVCNVCDDAYICMCMLVNIHVCKSVHMFLYKNLYTCSYIN